MPLTPARRRIAWYWTVLPLLTGSLIYCAVSAWRQPQLHFAKARLRVSDLTVARETWDNPECLAEGLQRYARENFVLDEEQLPGAEPLPVEIPTLAELGPGEIELTLTTTDAPTAVSRLTSIAEVYRDRITQATTPTLTSGRHSREQQMLAADSRREQLEAQCEDLTRQLTERGWTEAGQAVSLERLKILGQAVSQARLMRLEVERAWAEIRTALEKGTPLDTIVTELEPGAIREALQQVAHLVQVQSDLQQVQAEVARLQTIYRPRHPRMLELRTKIEDLSSQLPEAEMGEEPSLVVETLVQQTLSRQLETKQTAEQELQDLLQIEQGEANELHELQQKQTELQVACREAELEQAELATQLKSEPPAAECEIIQTAWLLPDVAESFVKLEWCGIVGGAMLLGWLLSWFSGFSTEPEIPVEELTRLHRRRFQQYQLGETVG